MGVRALRRAAFLDRDGVLNAVRVINGVTCPPESVADMRVLDGVAEGIDRLRRAGFLLVVVTNQPDVARGTQSEDAVHAINAALNARFRFDDVRVCFHDTPDRCACRKPQPGMLLDSAALLGIDLSSSVMIGDRPTDIQAGRSAGCRTVLVAPEGADPRGADFVAPSLGEAAEWVVTFMDTFSSITSSPLQ